MLKKLLVSLLISASTLASADEILITQGAMLNTYLITETYSKIGNLSKSYIIVRNRFNTNSEFARNLITYDGCKTGYGKITMYNANNVHIQEFAISNFTNKPSYYDQIANTLCLYEVIQETIQEATQKTN